MKRKSCELKRLEWPNYSEDTDLLMSFKYRCWSQQRNQALYRGEGWDLPFLTWVAVWGDEFKNKGQTADCMCMTRRDLKKPWTPDNVKIITRQEHFMSNRNKEGKFSRRKYNDQTHL